jgi:general secretion pathway protein K
MKTLSLNSQRKNFSNQSGTALITVVLIAAVVIILVLESIKIIRSQKLLSNNLINRDQAYSYLMGMEELAKIWLKKSFDNNKEDNVHLNQNWAQDNITFPLDGGGMTASIIDMQSCFNLNSIVKMSNPDDQSRDNNTLPNTPGQLVQAPDNAGATEPQPELNSDGTVQQPVGQLIFEELVNQIKENSDITGKELAAILRDWIDEDTEPFEADGAEDSYYQGLDVAYRTGNTLIAHTSELLAMKNFNMVIYQKLLPHICVLPDENDYQININTVKQDSAVLLYAALGAKGVTLSEVTQALNARGEKGFEKMEDFLEEFGEKKGNIDRKFQERLTVKSDYFQMSAKAEIGKTRVSMKTLFKKDPKNNFKIVSRYIGKE